MHEVRKAQPFAAKCRSRPEPSTPRTYPSRVPAGVSRSYQVSHKSDSDDDEMDFAFGVSGDGPTSLIDVRIGTVHCKAMVDSGATCNLLGRAQFAELQRQGLQAAIQPHDTPLFAYGHTKLAVLGQFTAPCKVGHRQAAVTFVVIEGEGELLIGRCTALDSGVLQLPGDEDLCASVQVGDSTAFRKKIDHDYPTVMTGVGKLKDISAKIHVDPGVPPVAQKPRRVPFALRDKVKAKIDELLRDDIIEEVAEPTGWVSPVVIIPKPNGDIRLCVDMRQANTAVLRERYPTPTVEEVLHDINGSTVFSKLDLRWGFHQVELDAASRNITTFAVEDGLYRFKCLMFGLSSAPEKYQKIIQQVISGCAGALNIADDIIVYGRTLEEHDTNLFRVLNRLQDRGLTLNV